MTQKKTFDKLLNLKDRAGKIEKHVAAKAARLVIYEKGIDVARFGGVCTPEKHGHRFDISMMHSRITFHDHAQNLEIYIRDDDEEKLVFNVITGEIRQAHLKDFWINELNAAYKEIEEKRQSQEIKEMEDSIEQTRSKWSDETVKNANDDDKFTPRWPK